MERFVVLTGTEPDPENLPAATRILQLALHEQPHVAAGPPAETG